MDKVQSPVRRIVTHTLFLVVIVLLACLYIYPVFLMVCNSLKPFKEILTNVLALPSHLEWANYSYVIEKMEYFRLFFNNVVITLLGILGIVAFSSMAAYILDRRQTRVTKALHTFIITPMLIPFQTIMITLLKFMNIIHLNGTTWGLGIQYWGFGIPMATFIYFNFMKSIPSEIDESAMIDGATTFQTYVRIIFPLLKTVTATVVVLDVMWIWNDFLLPLLMVNSSPSSKTLVLAAYNFVGSLNTKWHYALAAMVLAILPSVIVFVFLQRYIVDGVVAGAIKG
ncbi:MAG: carbohydrate ABC transporter permease [Clostridia bacterium]|nr:carbohydrate ABC transporter permease [Clostridia bacterium]MBQ9038281.1 carbohydrate ABC transporter permease [Clostridia bacterium]MBQ9041118.1 carbohydrate ABC transporter permease [Clostridia bacterium]